MLSCITVFGLLLGGICGCGLGLGLLLHWLVPAIDRGMATLCGLVATGGGPPGFGQLMTFAEPAEVEEEPRRSGGCGPCPGRHARPGARASARDRRAPAMLGRGVARLPGHVATRRADLEHPFVADLHGAGLRAPRLADVPDAGAGDRHYPRSARFAVVGGNRRGAVERLTIGVSAGWALEDDVAAWHPAHVEPPRVRPRHMEGHRIVVGIRPTNQDLPPTRQCVRDQTDLLVLRR